VGYVVGAKALFSAAGLVLLAGCGPAPKPVPATPTPEPVAPAEVAPVTSTTPVASASPTPTAKKSTPTPRPATPKPTPGPKVAVSTQPVPAELWKEFSGERAWRTVKQLVEIGPRPTGSLELGRARGVLASALRGMAWEVEIQPFKVPTPRGEIEGTNIIARFSADGSRPVARTARKVTLGTHYDTRNFTTIRFVGANEGASGPAVLLEAARTLALDPALAANIEIVFFDAAEPRSQSTPEDGLAGSKFYAKGVSPSRVLILQGVGDQASTFMLPPETPVELLNDLRTAHAAVNSPLNFKNSSLRIWGDHIPFGTSALFFGQTATMVRYTADDTLDRVSPATLGGLGELTVWLAKRWANP